MAAKSKKSSKGGTKSGAKKSNAGKSTPRKNTANKGRSSSRKKVNTNSLESNLIREAIGWIVILVGAITLISLFVSLGSFGKLWAGLLKSEFGVCSYVLPLLFVYLVLPLVLHESKGRDIRRAIFGVILFVLLCNFLQLLFEAGGNLGAAIKGMTVSTIGFAGSFVATVILIVICVVMLTEKSVIRGVKNGSGKAYSSAKIHGKKAVDSAKQKRQEQRERRARQVEQDRERKEEEAVSARRRSGVKRASTEPDSDLIISDKRATQKRSGVRWGGVTFDTTLKDEKKNPEFKEILSDPSEENMELPNSKYQEFVPTEQEENTVSENRVYENEVSEEILPEEIAVEETAEYSASEGKRAHFVNTENTQELFPDEAENIIPAEDDILSEAAREEEVVAPAENSDSAETIAPTDKNITADYKFPTLDMLTRGSGRGGEASETLEKTKNKLEQTLKMFGVDATVENYSQGPAVTRFEVRPNMGVKVSKIVNLADDIKLNLAAADIRIEAPIPGKPAVGIEVPNKNITAVHFGDLIASEEFQNSKSKLSFAVGKDLSGKTVVSDIAKMPHVLVAGATGSGKSVCINTLIMSILYKARPDEVKLIMVDPKVVELSVYNGIPHLLIPVVTDPKKAAGALNWAVMEMEKRYKTFAEFGVRDMKGFNQKVEDYNFNREDEDTAKLCKMYQLVVIVDELADLMMVASKEVEASICRLAQLARAAGIHLVIATQRPSVNVITGLIKANMPSRIAFSVTSGVDSRTIIDMNGAEKLLGKGDMLFFPAGLPKPIRVQGSFVSDAEVQRVVDFLKENKTESNEEDLAKEVQETMNSGTVPDSLGISASPSATADTDSKYDAYFVEAGRLIVDKEKASIGMLQRSFKIGFNRAARIMDQLCEAGVVGGEEGTKPRKILMSAEEYEEFVKNL